MTGSVRVLVDADGRAKVAGAGRPWLLDLQLGSGSAVVRRRRGPATRVRALRWGEKASLARFGSLGTAFRDRAVANACAIEAGDARAPDDVVATVAAWLEDPGRDAAAVLDADPVEIAAATLDVCRHLGLAPADVDALPAGEVATLWRALATVGEQASGEEAADMGRWVEDPSDGMTHIVVVDDDGTAEASDGEGQPPTMHVVRDPAPGEPPVVVGAAGSSGQSRSARRRGTEADAPVQRGLEVQALAADPPVLGRTDAIHPPTPLEVGSVAAPGAGRALESLMDAAAGAQRGTTTGVKHGRAATAPKSARLPASPAATADRPRGRVGPRLARRDEWRAPTRLGEPRDGRGARLPSPPTSVVEPEWPWAALTGEQPGLHPQRGVSAAAWGRPAGDDPEAPAGVPFRPGTDDRGALDARLADAVVEQLADELERAADDLGIAGDA